MARGTNIDHYSHGASATTASAATAQIHRDGSQERQHIGSLLVFYIVRRLRMKTAQFIIGFTKEGRRKKKEGRKRVVPGLRRRLLRHFASVRVLRITYAAS